MRLNKYLSEAGICSRRQADRLIESGKVTVDGIRADIGMKITDGQTVRVNGREAKPRDAKVILAVNKPAGIVCTEDRREKNNIIDFLNYPSRITYVGRLDKDSEGLLLMTDDGDIVNGIMRSRNRHEKEYAVTVDKPVTEEFIAGMRGGVPILNTVTRKCKAEKTGKYRFRIILTQGLNRQIRRMCEYFGYRAVSVVRTRVMNIRLGNLRPGEYRPLTRSETETLRELIKDTPK